jgi:predicted translin family RNA/ssDNA-binding protein
MTCEILQYFILPLEDYLLGLSDLTGELMRFAISGISRRGGRSKASDVCAFVRRCKAGKLYFQFTG